MAAHELLPLVRKTLYSAIQINAIRRAYSRLNTSSEDWVRMGELHVYKNSHEKSHKHNSLARMCVVGRIYFIPI